MRASHILLEHKMPWPLAKRNHRRTKEAAEEQMKELLERIRDGEAFYDVARRHSDCPSKREGGDLGRFSHGQMARKFSDAAFALEVGEMSGLVPTEFGIHIILRTE